MLWPSLAVDDSWLLALKDGEIAGIDCSDHVFFRVVFDSPGIHVLHLHNPSVGVRITQLIPESSIKIRLGLNHSGRMTRYTTTALILVSGLALAIQIEECRSTEIYYQFPRDGSTALAALTSFGYMVPLRCIQRGAARRFCRSGLS